MKKVSAYNLFSLLLLFFAFKVPAQQTMAINLKINLEKEATVFHDEPVLFHISVSNKSAQADERWNQAGEQRLEEITELLKLGKIKQEEYDKEKISIDRYRRNTESIVLGSESSSWTNSVSWKVMNTANRNYVTLPAKLMKRPETDGKALLDAAGYYMAVYGISPGALKPFAAGTYTVEFFINNIPSNAVLLVIENGMMSEAMAAGEPALLRFSQYYWHEENGEKVMEYANKALLKNPASLDALSLLGDGKVMQKSYLPALETYKKAVAEYYKQNGSGAEPPEYLLNMIEFVKKELGN